MTGDMTGASTHLGRNGDGEHRGKDGSVKEPDEEVVLILDPSGADLVKDLAPDEAVEQNREGISEVQLHSLGILFVHVLAGRVKLGVARASDTQAGCIVEAQSVDLVGGDSGEVVLGVEGVDGAAGGVPLNSIHGKSTEHHHLTVPESGVISYHVMSCHVMPMVNGSWHMFAP